MPTSSQLTSKIEKTKKRFIADAACPACGQKDCLALWQEITRDKDQKITRHEEVVECVECGHSDKQTLNALPNQHAPEMISVFKL